MRNEELDAVLAELKRAGVRDPVVSTGGRHLQVRWQVGAVVRFYTVSISGSDWRGPRNAAAEVRRMLKGDGLLAAQADPPGAPPPKAAAWRVEIERLEKRVAKLEAKVADSDPAAQRQGLAGKSS
jgi:hypothetical protein